MKWILPALLLTVVTITALPGVSPMQSKACGPSGGLNFICGLQAVEDLVPIPDTRWLIGSGMSAGSGMHLIDTRAKSARSLFGPGISSTRPDKTKFTGCPGPPDPKQVVLHGLSLRQGLAGRYTLYATNHGGRESVEVFEVDARNTTPTAVWTGCVLLPDMLAANSVAAFSDGTLVATVLVLPGRTFEDVWAGRNTGVVLMWTPGSKTFRTLAGTELSGNNGIETSQDNREFFVASTGLKRIVAYSRDNPSKPLRSAQLREFAPDNVRMVGNRLITVGMIDDEKSCGGAPKKLADIQCPRGWIVDAIDPKTMAITELARGPAAPPYTGSATAVPVGDTLWLSTFTSDRIAYRSLKTAATQAATAADAKCPSLAGNYVLQGEDGQVHISVKQSGCSTISITRNSGYLGKITREEHNYRVDGSMQPDSGWFGGNEKYQATPQFTPTSLRIDLRPQSGPSRTMQLSLTSKGDLIEDYLTDGKRLGGGPTVATRQK